MEGAFPLRQPRPRNARSVPARTLLAGHALALGLAAALAPAGCSRYVGTTAASFLRKVREEDDPNLRYLAYSKLANPNCYDSPAQKAEAVGTLVAALEKRKEPVASRAVIIQTLGALGDTSAREVVLKATSDDEPVVRVQACRALGRVGKPEDATVLARVMSTDTLEDCRIAAIEALGELKSTDPRIHRMLVAGMQNADPATRTAALMTLRKISGKDYGVDAVAWQSNFLHESSKAPEKGGETLLASPAPSLAPAPAESPALATAPEPAPSLAYPPRLLPRTVTDPSTQTTGYAPAPAAAPVNPPDNPRYPSRNPNLPATPPAR